MQDTFKFPLNLDVEAITELVNGLTALAILGQQTQKSYDLLNGLMVIAKPTLSFADSNIRITYGKDGE